jgi:histone deacetylase 1/2
MPQHEYYEYFGPDYALHVAPSNMENKNSRPLLDDIRTKLLDNLSRLQHAPSVPFQERPPNTELQEVAFALYIVFFTLHLILSCS